MLDSAIGKVERIAASLADASRAGIRLQAAAAKKAAAIDVDALTAAARGAAKQVAALETRAKKVEGDATAAAAGRA